jgi:hypothetical protein
LGRIFLEFVEKWFEHCNIIFRQCARDLGRKHFITERCRVKRWSDFIGLLTSCGAPGTLASGGFGFARYTPATFDVFYWPQVTNYGVLYVLFDSAPSGSNYIDVWDLSLHLQMASPITS